MCCKGFLKIMMFIFNGGIFLAGAALLGVGVWVTVDSSSLLGLLDQVEDTPDQVYQLFNIGYILIGVGAVLVVIGFLGCCGAIRESKCMLLTFFSIVLVIFIVEVAGGVVLLVFQDVAGEIFDSVENEMRSVIRKNYGKDEKMTSVWNATMEEFKCCGYKNYTDFDGSPFNELHGGQLYPLTCCLSNVTRGECNTNEAHKSNVPGCFNRLVQLFEENAVIIAAVAMGIAALEIAAMVVSMILYCNAGKKS